MWHCITVQDYQAICDICGQDFLLFDKTLLSSIKEHLGSVHNRRFETKSAFTLFCILQEDKIKCRDCSETYKYTYDTTRAAMYYHLKRHEVDISKAEEVEEMLSDHFSTSGTVNMQIIQKCNTCGRTFENFNTYSLLKHLRHHYNDVPQKYIPKG